MSPPHQIAIAGSSDHTVACAQSLSRDSRFSIKFALTPAPKPQGRTQSLSKNPVQQWAQDNEVSTILVKQPKITARLKKNINQCNQPPVDLLLVVDFGYFIPAWLRSAATIAPVNAHPSALPRWRGSSPGQFAILNGDRQSALTVFVINNKLDQGPIIHQEKFSIDPNWTQADYYQHSFSLIAAKLPDILDKFVQGEIESQPQPESSPTRIARQIRKNDAFVTWEIINFCQKKLKKQASKEQLLAKLEPESILRYFLSKNEQANWPQIIKRACQAFNPWPLVWTRIPTSNGWRRMQLIRCQTEASAKKDRSKLDEERQTNQDLAATLLLDRVKISGQQAANWNQVKNIVIDR